MANRRMFSADGVCTGRFVEMPSSTQALYFQLGMKADDDGFISSPKQITRMVGAAEDDLKLLAAKGFIIPFESGVVVISDWKINNLIRKDRYTPTRCLDEMKQLSIFEDKYLFAGDSQTVDNQMTTKCQPNDNQPGDTLATQVRLGKDSIGKDSINNKGGKSSRFIPPTVEEVREYCLERGNNVDAQCFVDFYSSKGWYVGKSKMKDWKASVRTWEKRRQVDSNNLQADRNELGEWLNA